MSRAAPLNAAAALLLLAGCSGADEAATNAAYQDCRGLADTAVETDRAIDQDILASRQDDWQRASVVRTQTRVMHEHTRDRAGAIVDSCMKGKGFNPKR
jgi:type IV pilus biogenesis protein CpaD/CtpE